MVILVIKDDCYHIRNILCYSTNYSINIILQMVSFYRLGLISI